MKPILTITMFTDDRGRGAFGRRDARYANRATSKDLWDLDPKAAANFQFREGLFLSMRHMVGMQERARRSFESAFDDNMARARAAQAHAFLDACRDVGQDRGLLFVQSPLASLAAGAAAEIVGAPVALGVGLGALGLVGARYLFCAIIRKMQTREEIRFLIRHRRYFAESQKAMLADYVAYVRANRDLLRRRRLIRAERTGGTPAP